jgi:hypothetical protein
VRRPADLDLVALGLGVAAAAFGVAAHTGPVLILLAVAVALARLVRARTVAYIVCLLIVPLLLWIGSSSGLFLAGVACVFAGSAIVVAAAVNRPEEPTDIEVAVRVSLAVAAGIAVVALFAFGNVYR